MAMEPNSVEKVKKNIQKVVRNETVSRGIRNYRALIFQGYVVLSVLIFGFLAVLAHFIPYFPIDLIITKEIQNYRPLWFDVTMKFISYLGVLPQIIIIIGLLSLLLYVSGLKWEATVSIISAALSSSLNIIIKSVVGRQRPAIDFVTVFQHLKDNSFPSGHVMLYTAFFGFFLFLSYTLLSRTTRRTFMITIFGLLIFLVGPSRIYEGEHWASDVFGAYLLGGLVLALIINFYRWGKPKYFVNQPTASPK